MSQKTNTTLLWQRVGDCAPFVTTNTDIKVKVMSLHKTSVSNTAKVATKYFLMQMINSRKNRLFTRFDVDTDSVPFSCTFLND